ncbi:NAD-dependent epimerase/dehydratase family protein [Arthrobacter rhombi]|uniref:NAD-dependent epimerase/dehydratase family protein n=1 Tax=Micrococcaceae TaxID=1268 RepID=UPI0018E999C7|nr:NAD(P)-dependent oxidoreductase [Glutamicibacter sp. BW78]MDN5754436.1 NAD(P)-dependent oxidoreductase [Micrococcaceae bacterium]
MTQTSPTEDAAGMEDFTGQRWIVTGAAGRIGRPLRRALAELGVNLVSVDVADTEPVGPTDTVVRGDVEDLKTLEQTFASADGVIHLGGISDEADFHDLAQVNIVGTYHVLEAARRAGVRRVVFASSNRLTGFYDVDTELTVDMPARPDGFYGVSKAAGEALCQLYSDKFGLSTIALRIGTYLSEPASPRHMRTMLSPGDAVRAFTAAMRTPQHHGVFYAVSKNSELWWNLDAGKTLGFVPVDDAAEHGVLEAIDPGTPQGGSFASAEYSLDRMRSEGVGD